MDMRVRFVFLVFLLFFSSFFPPPSEGEEKAILAPDPEFDPYGGPDVPVWHVGDFWNYTTEVEYDLGVVSVPLTGWLNMTVVAVTLDLLSSGVPVYITNLTGNVSAEETYPFVGDVNIYIELSGYIWNRAQDLAVYRNVLNASVSGTVSGINGNYPIGYEYHPGMEEYDLPLIPGDRWRVETSARVPFGGSGDIIEIRQNRSCGSRTSVSVPAGSFDVYPVLVNGRESLLYNSTVGNSVRRTYDIDDIVEGMSVPFELISFGRERYSIDVDLRVATEQHVQAGSAFSLHGELSRSNVVVNVFFPRGTLAHTTALVGSDTDLDLELTAPMLADDTPTFNDFSSLGIFVSVNGLMGVGAVTVTTKASDLAVSNETFTIEVTGNGTIDDLMVARIEISNPSNFRAENFTAMLEISGACTEIVNWNDLSVDGRSTLVLYHNFTVDLPGNYSASFIVDAGGKIVEYNERNNAASANFTVLMRPPIIWDIYPEEENVTVDEGETVDFRANATRGGEPLNGSWYLNDELISADNYLNLDTNHSGWLSSEFSPYDLRYVLSDNGTYPEDNRTSVDYRLIVSDVNRPHIIASHLPEEGDVFAKENETVKFLLNITEPDGDDLTYKWTVGNLTFEGWRTFSLSTNFTGPYSSEDSPMNVSVVVSDGRDPGLDITLNWTVFISDVDRPFSFETDPRPGLIDLGYNETLTISFNASDPDGTFVSSVWAYPGNISVNVTSIFISPADLGLSGGVGFNVTLLLISGDHLRTVEWRVSVSLPPPPPEEPVPVPPSGIRITSPPEGERFEEGSGVLLEAEADDPRNLTYVWILNQAVYYGSEVTVQDLVPGNYTVLLNVSSADEGQPGWKQLEASFIVFEKEMEEPPEDEADEEDFPVWPVIIMVGIVMALFIALMVALMRKKEEPWEE